MIIIAHTLDKPIYLNKQQQYNPTEKKHTQTHTNTRGGQHCEGRGRRASVVRARAL